jgi:hypothetical protein
MESKDLTILDEDKIIEQINKPEIWEYAFYLRIRIQQF